MTPTDPAACAIFLVLAFVLAGCVQTAWLRSVPSHRFAIPLDGGLTLRGRRLFGTNKTLRGLVAMVPAAGALFGLLAWLAGTTSDDARWGLWPLAPGAYVGLGLAAGLGFMLGELPNSLVKRQLGIAPGAAPDSRWAQPICFLVDRLDSILGMLVAVSLLVPTHWQTWVYVLLVGPAIHWSFSVLLFALGVKRRPA